MTLEKILKISKPIDFLDALVAYSDDKCVPATVEAQPRSARMVLLIRAFYLCVTNGDFGEFLTDSSCGGRIADLKEHLRLIGAAEALDFVRAIEGKFPNEHIPTDADHRFDLFAELEQSLGAGWIIELTQLNKPCAEKALSLLQDYLSDNRDDFESGFRGK